MTGLWKYYHNNGELNKIGEKENGEDIGEWKHYDENGKLSKIKKENDKEAVARIINYYLEGTRSDNPDLMRKAFHPDATLKFIDKEVSYKMIPIQKFFSYFTNTKSRLFESKIYYIDISGSTANVKLTAKYEEYKYIDYMNILKTKNGWKIVDAVSPAHNPPPPLCSSEPVTVSAMAISASTFVGNSSRAAPSVTRAKAARSPDSPSRIAGDPQAPACASRTLVSALRTANPGWKYISSAP